MHWDRQKRSYQVIARTGLIWSVLIWTGVAFPTLAASAQSEAGLTVLVVNSYDQNTAPYFQVRDAFVTELQRGHATPIFLRQFNLEERGTDSEASHVLRSQLLRIQYAETPPDLVVALGPPAVSFWLDHRAPDFEATPFVATAGEFMISKANLRPADATVVIRFTFAELVENILGLLPETSRIFIVLGASAHERRLSSTAKSDLQAHAGRVEFEFANDLPLKSLEEKLAGLAANTAVLFGIYDSDANGVLLSNNTGLSLVRAVSRAPVFGAFSEQLGHGIIGGRLINSEELGQELARVADNLLGGGTPTAPRKVLNLSAPTFDWRELQAWNIDVDLLPPGSTIRFKPPSLWQAYRNWIWLVAAVFVTQALLLTSLLLQRRRRRAAEQSSLNLGSRLITANEDERRRVARELHDDLAQRLARLSIDAGYLAANPGGEAAIELLQRLQPELVSISKDVHEMSHRLHPSLIDDLGIVAALRAECERVRRRHDVDLVDRIEELREPVPKDQALCIYRIVQEALVNAVRHAHADSIEVSLASEGRSLMLEVRDNGVGFDTMSHASGHGLGLASMRERAKLVGGSLNIRSRPGHGTTVSLVIPWKATEA